MRANSPTDEAVRSAGRSGELVGSARTGSTFNDSTSARDPSRLPAELSYGPELDCFGCMSIFLLIAAALLAGMSDNQ